MFRSKKLGFWPMALLLLAACNGNNQGTAKTAFPIETVKAHIADMNKSYGQRFTTNDTAFTAARYCADAVVYPVGHPTLQGRDSIRTYYYGGGNNKEMNIVITANNIYPAGDLVVEEGLYDFPDGKGGSYDKGKFIALWKEESGKWKLYREIWNTDIDRPQQ
jgi:ketosteroid isomerase-like protein